MRLGLGVSHHTALTAAPLAERLGYDVVVVPEGFQSDAPSVLGAVGAVTRRVELLAGVMQMPARTPGATALTAATLDATTGGRFRLGLGVSNPDIATGWYGTTFDRPLERTREYVAIVRAALARETVDVRGRHYRVPLTPDATEPLRMLARPSGAGVPILIAAVGPRNLQLCGEIADGWVGVFQSPDGVRATLAHVGAGLAAAGRDRAGFTAVTSVPLAPASVPGAEQAVRGYLARFLGMGAADRNVYCAHARRLGHGAAAAAVHRSARAGDLTAAAAAVPAALVDDIALTGSDEQIIDRIGAYAEAGVDVLALSPLVRDPAAQADLVGLGAELFGRAGTPVPTPV
jgi:F420-dependent oxidoreductase-like protein